MASSTSSPTAREAASVSASDSLERFAGDLRELKLRAGDPTLHALSSRIHVSKGVLPEAFSGRRLPSERTTLKVVETLGADAKEWLERRSLLDPRARRSGDTVADGHQELTDANGKKRRPWRVVLAVALSTVLAAGLTSVVWWQVLQNREAYWAAQVKKPLGDQFLEPADGVDPMQTKCREDKVIADVQTRQNDQFKVEMPYSNSCMGVWGARHSSGR